MNNKPVTNSFEGGLNYDDHFSYGSNKDYRYAKNIISSDDKQNTWKSNEHSTRKLATFDSNIVGKKYITELNSSIFFLEGGKIYIFNHNKEELKFVASADEFGCDWGMSGCEYINIHNYYQYINDIWLTYSSNKTYYNLNLTELLDEKRKAGLIQSLSSGCGEGCSQRTCEYFKTFKKSCDPHIEAMVLSGGSLRNGTYFIGGRYKNNQGGYSNPFIMTTALHVGGNDNVAGELSNQRIEISIQNTSCVFDQIEFFVHEIIDGNTITKAFPVQYITGSVFTIQYTGAEQLAPIDIAEILVNSRTYIEGEDLFLYDNKAIYYRTTPEFEYNFQSVANQIDVEWYAVKVPMQDVKKYQLKSYLRGETYAFSFSPNYDNGKKGYGFHIPAISGGGDCASIPYEDPIDLTHKSNKSKNNSSSSNNEVGSDNPALAIDNSIILFKGGCAAEQSSQYYLDTDNFCTATKLYINIEKTILAEPESYKIQSFNNSFIRVWNGQSFDFGCNVCINLESNSGSGSGSQSSNEQPSESGSLGSGGEVNLSIKAGLLYKRLRQSVPSTVNNPHQNAFTDFAKTLANDWETNAKDVLDTEAPACAPGGCDNGCIEEVSGGHCGGGSSGGGGGASSPEKRSDQNNTNLIYYYCESCINTEYKIIIASETTGLVGKCIVSNGECFNVLSIDTNPNSDFIFGELDYTNCNECKAFNGSGSNQSGSGSSSSSGGGGSCGGGCKSCGGKNCIDGKCYDTDTSTTETLFFDETNTLTGSSKTTGSINAPAKAITDEINSFCNVRDSQKNANILAKDINNAEEVGALWFNALSNYINEQTQPADNNHSLSDNTVTGSSAADLLKNPVEAIKTLKEASKALIEAVKNAEHFEFDYKPHTLSKSVSYSNDSLTTNNRHEQDTAVGEDSVISYDDKGNPKTNGSSNIEVQLGIYNKYPIVARGKTKPKIEKNTYPCITDCYGNQIYCGLGGSNVTHHTMPTNAEVPFWIPKSAGDGSTYQSDSSIMDGYAVLILVQFKNINIPAPIRAKLCPTNPYTIGVVKRDSNNSSIIMKGAGTEGYTGYNQDKQYLYFKYGLNSQEKISKYIDSDGAGKRFQRTSDDPNNIFMYSLDQLTRSPFLNGTHIIREGTMAATGARHSLYSKGMVSKDNRARRRDQGGSIHTAMVHSFRGSNTKIKLTGQTYAEPNEAVSPASGNDIPFMNKSGQSCAWFTAPGIARGINDDSFVGDVLQDKAPITNGRMDYFSIFRELDSQYGDITNLNYVPILQARGFSQVLRGFTGDTYIGPYSFVKTGFVSDKVGNYFPIKNMVSGKADRCICDDPNDAIHSVTGNWYWKELPIDGDAADAKRWAGTHTTTISRTWNEARNFPTESHYYFPATTKHLITYVGESEANPWLREKSDLLENQWYPEIKSAFSLHSGDNNGGDWENGYLNQYYKLIEQASLIQLALKVLIMSTINIAVAVLGLNEALTPETALEGTGNLLTAVMNMAVYVLATQVLFTNNFVDKFLRLDACKRDEEGGEEQIIEGWFENYSRYNNDYSIDYFYPTIKGLPMEYTGCMATSSVTNTIYISDPNDVSYYVNGYQVVRPNSKIMVDDANGKITSIYSLNGKLYIHTTDGILATQSGQITIPTNMSDILAGNSNLILQPQLITNSSDECQYGLEHPNHGKVTPLGFIFVDYNSKDLVIFTGNNFDVLSDTNRKMNTFFKKYLEFCSQSDCMFEQKENTPHYSFGIDNKHRRLLFTKSDGENSYTLSYDLLNKRWLSFHDYLPNDYLNDRNILFSLHRNELHAHDDYSKFSTYYDKFYGISIDVICALDQTTTDWLFTEIYTDAEKGFSKNRDITFNQVGLLNSWQTSGIVNLKVRKNTDQYANDSIDKIIDKVSTIDLTREVNRFRFNELFDYTQNHEAPIIHYDGCNPEPMLINYGNSIDRSDQAYNNRIVSDNYYYYRFIFNTFADVKLYLKKIDTFIQI
jgi:hypothetical protein